MPHPHWSATLSILAALLLPSTTLAASPPRAGMTLPFHSTDPAWDYRPMVREIAALGATDISLIINLYQDDARSPKPQRHPLRTPGDTTIKETIREARRLGLRVMVMPIVLLEKPKPDDWRGNLSPPDWKRWYQAYRGILRELAMLADAAGADLLAIGSELSSLETYLADWRELITDLRKLFSGKLTYSANWDHYDSIAFWSELDFMGISGYYELSTSLSPSRNELITAWRAIAARILRWRKLNRIGVPLLFTELGYPSQDGCASKPWNYLLSKTVDLEEQRLCYEAFITVWSEEPELAGVFFYEWWGLGGPKDEHYTPRGKPAEAVLREWFRSLRAREPR